MNTTHTKKRWYRINLNRQIFSLTHIYYYIRALFNRWYRVVLCIKKEVFYGTQYHHILPVEKDSYVIYKDLCVRIRRLRLILYH
jgi:hypothetical protein